MAKTPDNIKQDNEKPKPTIDRKDAFHNALRGIEFGISAGGLVGTAIAFTAGVSVLPAVALVASFAIIGAAVAIEGNPFVFFKECCKKGINGIKKLVGKSDHEMNVAQEQTPMPAPPAVKQAVTVEQYNTELPSMSFQQKLLEQSRVQAQGKGV